MSPAFFSETLIPLSSYSLSLTGEADASSSMRRVRVRIQNSFLISFCPGIWPRDCDTYVPHITKSSILSWSFRPPPM
jgi:hypothetical protein